MAFAWDLAAFVAGDIHKTHEMIRIWPRTRDAIYEMPRILGESLISVGANPKNHSVSCRVTDRLNGPRWDGQIVIRGDT